MMMVPVTVGKSAIHGMGIFAVSPIRAGTVIWEYTPGLDRQVSHYAVNFGDPRIISYIKQRGYVNPDRLQVWVICVDEAQFWNFPKRGEPANTKLGGLLDGEYLILAARDIEANEEITIPPESDADYSRKMEGRP